MATVHTTELPPPQASRGFLGRAADTVYEWITARLPPHTTVPLYSEPEEPRAADFPKVLSALEGVAGGQCTGPRTPAWWRSWRCRSSPCAASMVPAAGGGCERCLGRRPHRAIHHPPAFSIALAITVLLSLYFAGTIARPVRRLARAAERVRAGGGRKVTIPDFTARNDEIGRLSAALREMTDALWVRMDAIERFAADVAHEVKNPLSSVLTAVDTARHIDDEEKREKLLALVGEDVKRLDRLLSQIADASKIDTELARAQLSPVDLGAMLATIAAMQAAATTANEEASAIRLDIEGDGPFVVLGVEDRLAQVLQNLIGNARTFSPPDGAITLGLRREGARISITVEDDGPGVPAGIEEAIFRRFYTFRPEGEAFGSHSGLGLSISRQIAEAHGGRLTCSNRIDRAGRTCGACFRMELPATAPLKPEGAG